MRHSMDTLIEKLAESGELAALLRELKVTPRQAVRALTSAAGERRLELRRKLSQVQRELQVQRQSGKAIEELTAALGDDKGEVRLKAALALLSLSARQEKGAAKAPKRPRRAIDPAAEQELMQAIAQALTQRRQKEAMGAPPGVEERATR